MAVTRAGQIKGRGERHEKDDRHRIDDRSRYVLGWSNEQKIAALKREQQRVETRRAPLMDRIDTLERQRNAAQERNTRLAELAVFESFRNSIGGRWSRRSNGWTWSAASWKKGRTFCARCSSSSRALEAAARETEAG